MERFSFIFLTAGIGFFALAFGVSGWLPMMPVQHLEVRTVEQLAEDIPVDFAELKEQYPDAYNKAFPGMNDHEAFAAALRRGHKIYVGEACWHCHSQQVRPWGNDEARFGRVSFPEEYNHKLAMPPLWGTRRVGPDLARQAGVHSNDWHVAHFYNPPAVVDWSVMPAYPWFYEADGLTPNRDGLSIIAYVQWLGSWLKTTPADIYHLRTINRAYEMPDTPQVGAKHSQPAADAAPATPAAAPAPAADDAY